MSADAMDNIYYTKYFMRIIQMGMLLESAAMGRICIGSRIAGTEDVIDDGKTGYLFEAGNVE